MCSSIAAKQEVVLNICILLDFRREGTNCVISKNSVENLLWSLEALCCLRKSCVLEKESADS